MHNIASIRKTCANCVGGWVQFQTPWGTHQGIVQHVSNDGMLVRVPRQYAPALASTTIDPKTDRQQSLDPALAQWGYPYAAGYPNGYGWWVGRWWWWWVAFAAILALAFLWW
ncbi:hypothetical protein [Effusibacillus pohliae]|uniref:hypothetical protein n=1 Tax=Effusibacillus pohliae TaxID=232270 RepID=UPI00036E2059|nr:hypothetical protein [Effusibacillus pohliae]